MVAGVEKKTNKWPKDVNNDKEYSEIEKPVRDLLKFRKNHDDDEFCYELGPILDKSVPLWCKDRTAPGL
ncbi:hypothetical protein FoTM2_009078 [Fusarium oxysporum f. sp. vasinfectum]|uniref:Uncharacterized protein n=1 Tax=Fusarium oxysporum f. sp. vasinfectum 25433 TaxID=1089449 RepID=X0MBL1_FUSOX|nr:hypothetical protein FOTG_13857 [Fusarium oxysporum f. sp. vasinfectum 25433]KAK2931566.1 hypothetical protein FoTM2_009078 [Fusarium oxysporum f. sp. vasinfectum]